MQTGSPSASSVSRLAFGEPDGWFFGWGVAGGCSRVLPACRGLLGCLGMAFCPLASHRHPPLARFLSERIQKAASANAGEDGCKIRFLCSARRGIEMRTFKTGLETPGRVRGTGSGPALLPGRPQCQQRAVHTVGLRARAMPVLPAVPLFVQSGFARPLWFLPCQGCGGCLLMPGEVSA